MLISNTNELEYITMQMNTGIDAANRKVLAGKLGQLLADSYLLYLKTHNFHWNVTGPQFTSLHLLFEQFYTELATAVDEIAERIRALGHPAPGSYQQFRELSQLPEETGVPASGQMIEQLVAGQEIVIATARALVPLAEEANDDATADLATQRIQLHEKNAWMLRSLLE